MKLTYIIPAFGLHQKPISLSLYNLLGNNFHFVATTKIENGRFGLNYDQMADEYDFVLRPYRSEEEKEKTLRIIRESNVVVIGGVPDMYTDLVNQNTNIIVFRYCERFFKNGSWHRFIPRTHKKIKHEFLVNNYRQNFAVLSASAYTANDLHLSGGTMPCYQFGYFPDVLASPLPDLMKEKSSVTEGIPYILWSGRFTALKRCKDFVNAIYCLKKYHLTFRARIIGGGDEQNAIQRLIRQKGLEQIIELSPPMSTTELHAEMAKADIFAFTSARGEGWGAIVNEAMSAACAVVAGRAAGCVPFLIKDGENGLIYDSCNAGQLSSALKRMLEDIPLRQQLAQKAYEKITLEYTPEVAAQRLVQLATNYLDGNCFSPFSEGVCSPAGLIKPSGR